MAKYKLNDIAPVQQGIVPKCEKYWLLNLDMVESNTGKILDYLYVAPEEIGTSTVSFDVDNVLYSKLRPYLNKVVLPERYGYATSELLPLRPDKRIITREYLTYFLRSPHFVAYINEKTSGAKMPRANSSDLKAVEVECPAIETQKKITTIFDQIVSIIGFRKKQLQTLDDLIKARFVEMFEEDFPQITANVACEVIVDCPHATPKYKGNELICPAIRTSEIKNGFIDWTSMKYVSREECRDRNNRLTPKRGDIVYAREGTYGDCVILPDGYDFCLGQRTMLFRPNYELITSEYLHQALRSDNVKRQADISNAGSTVPHVNVADAKEFSFPLPPLELQNQFATFVNQVDKSKVVVQQALDKAQLLFDSLMQQYFG